MADLRLRAVREGLRGATDHDAPEVISRLAGGHPERLPALARELVENRVDAIIAVSPIAVQAARGITTTVPIIAVDLGTDPVASGLVASLAHPGGNVTGVFLDLADVSAKCLQILVEFVPGLSRVGVLWDPTTGPYQLRAVETAAVALGVALHVMKVNHLAEVEEALRSISREGGRGILLLSSPLFVGNPQLVADLALDNGLAAITLFPEFAQAGGMLAYGPDLQELFRQAAVLARKVLQGGTPMDLPVERPTRFQLIVNLKAASALGITVPTPLLARADELIE